MKKQGRLLAPSGGTDAEREVFFMSDTMIPQTSHDRKRFLRALPPAIRSPIANLFHSAVRRGCTTPSEVVADVQDECRKRLARARASGDFYGICKFELALTNLAQRRESALDYANEVIAWEKLSCQERKRIKQQKALRYSKGYWEHRPPTEKQINLLMRLGYQGTVLSRGHASRLIGELLGKDGGEK